MSVTYTPISHRATWVFVDGPFEASGGLFMVKRITPNQAAIKPFLCFRARGADLSTVGAQVVSVGS
jgi:hypothetical protein